MPDEAEKLIKQVNNILANLSSTQVRKLHERSDVDASINSLHHTIGPGESQVASGAHIHDGRLTKKLLASDTVTGAKGGNVALANLIAILVNRMGLTDTTT